MNGKAQRPHAPRWLVPLLGLLLAAPATVAAQAREVTPTRLAAALSGLDRLATQAVSTGGVPGLSIAVVHDDKVIYLKGFGVREAGRPGAVTPDTVFQLASMSKPIASTVVAAIVSRGAATWDDPAIKHDPGFQLKDPWATREVTLRDLFSHRSGLPGDAGDDLDIVGYSRDEILRRLRYIEPASSLRANYAYSNFGLTEGGVAAARAIGKTWEDAAAELLYRPLGMTATSSRFKDYATADNRALLHVGKVGAWKASFTRQPDAQSPAGGVSSTARDLAQWLRLQLGGGMLGGKQVIGADALAETHLPQIAKGMNPATGLSAFYGLGWNVEHDEHGRLFWSHAGAFSLGARTYVSLLPAENLGIVILSNAFPTGVPDGLANSFYDLALNGGLSRDWIPFWNGLYQRLYDSFGAAGAVYATPPAQPSSPLPLSAYLGTYHNDYFGEIEVVEEKGHLVLRQGPQSLAFPLRHFDRDLFTYLPDPELPAALAAVTFTVGPDRRAQSVVLGNLADDGRASFTRVQLPK
ncbi:serine hydrolase [Deinococcus humi]|uniref:CubicO group peptidase (Beta-lactamase class C family) n=1 Tax=Deinococcus humi TaxID=662880 RepID=A0A7W8NHX4_9DEIO|nr:serine hydrolase [Deinococcus humi]MBB5366345.1 CubicO group peptidase (beta-lactamase class C family) [Deinococcus humi]GGO41358.1 serine hydrolase [Deinococcus humi]